MIRSASFVIAAALLATTAAAPGTDVKSAALSALQIDQIIAAARTAAGGAKLDDFISLTQTGTIAQDSGAPNDFETTVDLRNGYWRTDARVGPETLTQGYDGVKWDAQDGPLTIVSLPALVADAVTQAYLASDAFLRPDKRAAIVSGRERRTGENRIYILRVRPAGGSSADLYFNGATSLLVKIVEFKAQGPDIIVNDDFQRVQGITLPMRSTEIDSRGGKTLIRRFSARFATSLQPGALARPNYIAQGHVAASIPFTTDVAGGGAGHLIVPVLLGVRRIPMLFDTGGANLLLPEAMSALGLRSWGSIAVGLAGTGRKRMTGLARVPSVNLGGATLVKQDFMVMPLPYVFVHPRKGLSPQGIIGFQYLANYRVIVRYADRHIDLEPFDAPALAGGVTLPFKSDGAYAYVEATLDGVTGYYLVDTGNALGIEMNAPFVRTHRLFSRSGLSYEMSDRPGAFAATLTAAKSFSFAGHTFNDVPVLIPNNSNDAATRGVAGILGAPFLSRFTCVFDYKSQTVTFIPNENVDLPFTSDRVGLGIAQSGPDALDVFAVVPGSPAAQAGIMPGDRVTAFADKNVSAGYGLGDFLPYITGSSQFSVTFTRGDATRTATLVPQLLLPAPQ